MARGSALPVLVGLVACASPLPPPAALVVAPDLPMRRAALPAIVPLSGQPGFRVCVDCAPATPSPKTLAGAPQAALPARALPVASVSAPAPEPVTVRYAASIPFAFGESAIGPAGEAAIETFIARLPAGLAPRLVSVAGRTDSTGSRAANARIAQARAETVLADLRKRLKPAREEISAEPLCCYIASNATAAGRADNRRVDVAALIEIQ